MFGLINLYAMNPDKKMKCYYIFQWPTDLEINSKVCKKTKAYRYDG